MKKTTQFSGGFLVALIACFFAASMSSHAVITYHTGYNGGPSYEADADAFASALISPTGLSEDFTGYSNPVTTPLTLSGGTPTYNATLTPGSGSLLLVLGPDGGATSVGMSTYDWTTIGITFAGGASVTAVGATFYLNDFSGAPILGDFSIRVNSEPWQSYSASGPVFLGFTSDSAITSLSLRSDTALNDGFIGLDNLRVGAAVPEASTLLGAGFLGLLLCWQPGRKWFGRLRVA